MEPGKETVSETGCWCTMQSETGLCVCVFPGLENIFLLTMRKENELRVDMEDWNGERRSAQYSSFSIESETVGYQLHLGSFTWAASLAVQQVRSVSGTRDCGSFLNLAKNKIIIIKEHIDF